MYHTSIALIPAHQSLGSTVNAFQNDRIKQRITPAFGIPFEGLHMPQAWKKSWYTSSFAKMDQMYTKADDTSISIIISRSDSSTMSGPKTSSKYQKSDPVSSILGDASVSNTSNSVSMTKDRRNQNIWIGNIYVTKLKLGETISRIHPDYTSALY